MISPLFGPMANDAARAVLKRRWGLTVMPVARLEAGQHWLSAWRGRWAAVAESEATHGREW